jgi:membrane-bound serine protease (ClpP class)
MAFLLLPWMVAAVACAQQVCWTRVAGPIGPATADYISRAIQQASDQNAACLVIELDTPGGLLDSTKQIVQALLGSPVPTVVYVSPQGASAASAGCFITLAGDIAAMAPATTIGAAHPVSLGAGGNEEQNTSDTMKQKLENYTVSFVESIALRRNRNVEWARSSVRQSASIESAKAMELHVVDLIATNRQDLLKQLDGRSAGGRVLHTETASIIELPPTTREKVLQKIWHPEVIFFLMLLAMYGIIGELSNPGAILPGVVGAISLVLMLYMASVLSMNVAGIGLVLLAVALFVADALAPTHGVLTAGATLCFFLGALMMFDRSDPMMRLSLGMIIPATALTAAFFIFVVGKGLRAQYRPHAVGPELLVGKRAIVLDVLEPCRGRIFVEGEYWDAVSDAAVVLHQPVEIMAPEGMTLRVRPANAKGA